MALQLRITSGSAQRNRCHARLWQISCVQSRRPPHCPITPSPLLGSLFEIYSQVLSILHLSARLLRTLSTNHEPNLWIYYNIRNQMQFISSTVRGECLDACLFGCIVEESYKHLLTGL